MHLRKEIDKLKKNILALSAVVEESVRKAMVAATKRDSVLARQVLEEDAVIDQMEVDFEEECLKILALHQPVAIDLRFIIAVLKINNDLERIGDYATNIAERAMSLAEYGDVKTLPGFPELVKKVRAMLKDSLDALVNMDAALAEQVILLDDDVDEIHRDMFVKVQDAIRKNPKQMVALIHMLSISRYLERIADLATNISEDTIYMIDGKIVRHKGEEVHH